MRFPARLKRSRHGIYYFRLVIPKTMRSALGGRTEMQHSLHTRDPQVARRFALALSARLDEAFFGRLQVAGDDEFVLPPNLLISTFNINVKTGEASADPRIPGDSEALLKAMHDLNMTPAT